jgi:hypothetical protein
LFLPNEVLLMAKVIWENAPDAHDYPAANSYLSLLVADEQLRVDMVAQLQVAPVAHYKAKDLLRASQLALLTADNPHVAADLRKIRKLRALSPVLLVRGDLLRGFPLQIADGYHRICASYHVNENTDIPCRMIELPGAVRAGVAAKKAAKAVPAKKAVVAKKVAKKAAPAKKAVAKKVAKKAAKKVAKRVAKAAPPATQVATPVAAAGPGPEAATESGSTSA